MASAHDRAVLQAIFNPTTPFGDIPGLNQEEELIDDGALGDLDRAISLSGGARRTACQALVQRGLLHRLECRGDEARADFEKAAALGSEFARQQAVALNPYAALCNKMLSEVINKLRNPEVSQML
ncbi:tetratricopeptide repeat protein 36 isoform X2 [Anoplopoma fimbria]|uniref:tetratricopeptide repeat protein 36 isoform X2 n=1 Tax=Anoplopoma fimbria TaxID=229290 RepID=UPI0023EACC02|nr:tetratricopeptide repeat protein 36 isoform X2 [Anoplopoma fimbria]